MTMIAVRPEDRFEAAPASREQVRRPAYLKPEVLSRAIADAEDRLLVRVKKMRGECQL